MLSYMIPINEKPPSVPGKNRLQLDLEQSPLSSSPEVPGRRLKVQYPGSAISKESSTSSFASSDHTASSSMTPTSLMEKHKQKLLGNGTKLTSLKRVSFGSSKGSMVETLIYESALNEDSEVTNSKPERTHEPTPLPYAVQEQEESERSKVRVSFYQGVRPQCVSPPLAQEDYSHLAVLLAEATEDMAAAGIEHPPIYNRNLSTESGWDNPFRPDGDLSREADEIVSLIKGGKPITPTPGIQPYTDEIDKPHQGANLTAVSESPQNKKTASPKSQSTPKPTVNGTKNGTAVNGPGQVEVQRSTPVEPQQAEHVVIKKKPKCKCCVVQ